MDSKVKIITIGERDDETAVICQKKIVYNLYRCLLFYITWYYLKILHYVEHGVNIAEQEEQEQEKK